MSKDIKKALEHCIEWNCVECPNREELGSGETVCRGRLLPDVLEYVADLEAKLAESEKQIKDARELGIEQFHSLKEIINSSQEEIDKLKQQLDEKEKELSEYVKIVDYLHKQLSDKCDFCDKTKYQDKISFAVEQLEQIRKEFEIKFKGCKWEDKMLVGKFCNITNEIIDNTINVLRNNKDGIH